MAVPGVKITHQRRFGAVMDELVQHVMAKDLRVASPYRPRCVHEPPGPACSVLVPMTFVGGVPASVVNVVDMIAMGHAHVPTSITMLMRMASVPPVIGYLALVDVPVMDSVQVPIVDIVDVIAVRYGHVTASRPVRMIMAGMLIVRCHGEPPLSSPAQEKCR